MSESENDALDEFEELARNNSKLDVNRDNGWVWVKGDFNELPSAGEAPDTIGVVSVRPEGYLDVRPIDVGGERKEVTPEGAMNYIERTFL